MELRRGDGGLMDGLRGLGCEVYVELTVAGRVRPRGSLTRRRDRRPRGSRAAGEGALRGGGHPVGRRLAHFIRLCREQGVVFKATAGLHQPVRSGAEHGFSTCSPPSASATRALSETDPSAFGLDPASFRWRDREAGRRSSRQRVRASSSAAAPSSSPSRSCTRWECSRSERLRHLFDRRRDAPRGLAGRRRGARPRCSRPGRGVRGPDRTRSWRSAGRRGRTPSGRSRRTSPRERPHSYPHRGGAPPSLRRRRLRRLLLLARARDQPRPPLPAGRRRSFPTAASTGRVPRPRGDGRRVRDPVVRPSANPAHPAPRHPVGPSTRLDVELELGFVVGGGSSRLGEPVPGRVRRLRLRRRARQRWSARDIQAWEYQPLGRSSASRSPRRSPRG